jgi:DNA-binding response OmpR family regulator
MPTSSCFYVRKDGQVTGQIDLKTFPFTLGRSRDCDFVVDTNAISREHLTVDFVDERQVIVRDLGSRNGTFLNGQQLTPHQDYPLRSNDVVNVADEVELVFDDPATTAQLDIEQMALEGLRIEPDTENVFIGQQLIEPPLSPSQVALVQLLLENEGVVVTRDDIRLHVWGEGMMVSDQAMDALVSRLRKRLAEFDPTHEYIITRRGFGLIFHNRRRGYTDLLKP